MSEVPSQHSNAPSEQTTRIFAAVVVAVAALAAYHNCFDVPFIFDDVPSIVQNPTIRRLWPISTVFHPAQGTGFTVEGRPILNLSFALNYAVSGTAVWSYHLVNLGILIASALALLGIVRRTLARIPGQANSLGIAVAAALIWELHPLQTESVTYVVQRAESLMGLFYLFTLYAFIRGTEDAGDANRGRAAAWRTASWAACLLGMATKEVTVTAPVIVFLYDRTFVAGSFRSAWQRRGSYYLALAATWALLFVLVIGAGNRAGTIGTSAGVTSWQYALCQCRAIVHYLRLSFWPEPLILDYGADFVRNVGDVIPYAILDIALLAATAVALRRRPALGFLGAWFFLILAPTSSFVGGSRQMLAEHRMYLSLAALAVGCVYFLHAALGRRGLYAILPIVVALGFTTLARNEVYRSPVTLFRDLVAKRPLNAWAEMDLGYYLQQAGRISEAVAHYHNSIYIDPKLSEAHFDLANALVLQRRLQEANAEYEISLRITPTNILGWYNLACSQSLLGLKEAAVANFGAALRLAPDYASAHYRLGIVLLQLGRTTEAAAEFNAVLKLRPGFRPALEQLNYLSRL